MIAGLLGLAGVVLGAFLSRFLDWLAATEIRRRQAHYLAIRVVCVLDQYMEACARIARDDGSCEGRPDENGSLVQQVEDPQKPMYADDIDWKSIDADLMYAILSFPNEIYAADQAIREELEF